MTLRCPYCHTPPEEAPARCRGCGAMAHAECALELAHCATCGDSRWAGLPVMGCAGWTAVPGLEGRPTFLRASRAPLAEPVPPRLRVDLQRRREPPGGLLAGTAWLSLPPGAPGLELELVWQRPRRGWLGARWLVVGRTSLWSPSGAAPGLHTVEFRTPTPTAGARLTLALGGSPRLVLPLALAQAGRGSRQVAG